MNVRTDIVSAIAQQVDRALVALDFDGTLAPLVPDPSESRLVDGARAALSALAALGARIAIVTGRDAPTVVELSGLGDLPGLDVEGIYGMQRWHDGHVDTPDEPPALGRLRERLPRVVDDEPGAAGVWIEDKGLSLVVHARRAADPGAALDLLRAPVRALGEELGLEVHPGRDVLELRLPGYDKGAALRRLVGRYEPAVVLYVGDDVGDLPAFDEVRALRADGGRAAWSAGVLSEDVPELAGRVDLGLDDPADVARLLGQIADAAT